MTFQPDKPYSERSIEGGRVIVQGGEYFLLNGKPINFDKVANKVVGAKRRGRPRKQP